MFSLSLREAQHEIHTNVLPKSNLVQVVECTDWYSAFVAWQVDMCDNF